jgi:hypothetical protein
MKQNQKLEALGDVKFSSVFEMKRLERGKRRNIGARSK